MHDYQHCHRSAAGPWGYGTVPSVSVALFKWCCIGCAAPGMRVLAVCVACPVVGMPAAAVTAKRLAAFTNGGVLAKNCLTVTSVSDASRRKECMKRLRPTLFEQLLHSRRQLEVCAEAHPSRECACRKEALRKRKRGHAADISGCQAFQHVLVPKQQGSISP